MINKIVIFVKAPVAGKVKTRLCPPFSYEEAAELYKSFVDATVKLARQVADAQVEVAYDSLGKIFPEYAESYV